MKNNINFIHFQTFFVNASYANTRSGFQTLVCIFDFFIPVVNLQYVIKQEMEH